MGVKRSSQLLAALSLTVALSGFGAASAGAAAGEISEYPIAIETTPYGITAGPDGKLWVLDSGNHVGGTFIGRMATSGAMLSSDLVQLPSSKLGLAASYGPDGNMWELQDSTVEKMPVGVSETAQITPYALSHGTGGYGSIVPGPDGRMWFGWDTQIGATTTTGTISEYETNSSTAVSGVTVGADGKLWYGEFNKIARMDTGGHIGLTGDEFPLPGGASTIEALVLGPDGNIWFTVGNPAAIGRITTSGAITLFPTPTPASLPFGIADGPDGRLWFTEENANAIGSIPTSATSGADITEYSLGSTYVGALYITAGSDSRMWFTEFSANKLGAIATGFTPAGPPSPPPASPPASSPTAPLGVASLPALPPVPSPAGCVANKLILTDVFPQGGRTQMLGVAPAGAGGKRVSIVSRWNGKTVAKATVQSDLSFKTSAPLPPRSLRFTNRALYAAKLGSVSAPALKFARRMYATSITAAGRTISFTGLITPPLAKPLQMVTIRASSSCSTIRAGTIVATIKPKPSGAYTTALQLPPAMQGAPAVYLQAETRVRQNRHSKKTFPSFTLVRGVKLTP